MAHEAIDVWIDKATSVIEENEAFRASVLVDLGHRAIDAVLAEEDRFKDGLRGSQDEIDVTVWERRQQYHSPNFFV